MVIGYQTTDKEYFHTLITASINKNVIFNITMITTITYAARRATTLQSPPTLINIYLFESGNPPLRMKMPIRKDMA